MSELFTSQETGNILGRNFFPKLKPGGFSLNGTPNPNILSNYIEYISHYLG